MAIDNLVSDMYAANIRIASAADSLDSDEQEMLTSCPEYATDKSKAAANFLNNFYFRMPGGFLTEFISRAIELRGETGEDSILRLERLREYKQVAEDVRVSLLDSELGLEECTKISSLESQDQKKYLFSHDNFYRFMPIMLDAYIALRKKGYKREELVS